MKVEITGDGWEVIYRPPQGPLCYVRQLDAPAFGNTRVLLWLGEHLVAPSEVSELVAHLQAWLATGSLMLPEPPVQSEPTLEVVRPDSEPLSAADVARACNGMDAELAGMKQENRRLWNALQRIIEIACPHPERSGKLGDIHNLASKALWPKKEGGE